MKLPVFVDIETSHSDEGGYPTAIAWSLSDGSIKSVQIIPDDEWDPWDNAGADVDVQHLMDQGESGPEIIRELNQDLCGQTVFVDGLDDDEHLLEYLFDTYSNAPDFELASLSQLMPGVDIEDLLTMRQQIASEHQLDIGLLDDNIRAMLFLFKQLSSK